MSYGLEVFDAAGQKTLRGSDLTLRYITIQNPPGTSGSFSAPGCTPSNSYVYLISTKGTTGAASPGEPLGPVINYSISNQRVYWNSNINLEGGAFFVVFQYR